MKIERNVNGRLVEFELTPEELYDAYKEQQHILDVRDIVDKFEGEMDPSEVEDEYGVPAEAILNNESLLEEMARESRHNQEAHGMEWQFARDDAIRDVLDQHRDELLSLPSYAPTSSPKDKCSVFPGLPEVCFSVEQTTGNLVVIKRGEMGCYRSPGSTASAEKNQEIADGHNAEMGITKAQVAAMVMGSMFGWNVRGANPEAYDEQGKLMKPTEQAPLEAQITAAEQVRRDAGTPAKGRLAEIERG